MTDHFLSPERLDALQASWVRLLANYSIAPADAYPIFDRLVAAHSEPQRAYHTLEHIAETLRVAGRLSDFANDPRAVQLALWFHDAIYDPTRSDNEASSAELARAWLVPVGVPNAILDRVAELILATAHAEFAEPGADTAVILDADLAILSAEPSRYARYAADVRREYSWVDDAAFRAGRGKVLRSFLDRPRIYRTSRMYEVAEPAARANLAAELARYDDPIADVS